MAAVDAKNFATTVLESRLRHQPRNRSLPENLSEETKCLLEVAEKEAKELGCAQVETSHLLLALMLDKGRIGEILKSEGATEQAAREYFASEERSGNSQWKSEEPKPDAEARWPAERKWDADEPKPELQRVTNPAEIDSQQLTNDKASRKAQDEPVKKIPLSPDAEIILERAVQEAYSWRHGEVGTVHVLQCLLGIYEPEDPEFKLLLAMGVDHTALKRKVGIHLKLLPRQGSEKPVEEEKMELPELTFESFTQPYSIELDVSSAERPGMSSAGAEGQGVAARGSEVDAASSPKTSAAAPNAAAQNTAAGSESPAMALVSPHGQSGSLQERTESLNETPDFANWLVEFERREPGASRLEIATLVTKFFTPEAQSIIERSRQMADRNFAPSVGVHHILLAMLDIEGTNVHTMLNRYFHTKKMKGVLLEEVPPGVSKVAGGYFTQEAVVFLDLSWQTAQKWKFSKITPDIMLLQLIDECNREFFKEFVIVNAVGVIPDAVFMHVLRDILQLYPDIEGGLPTRYLKERLSVESGGTSGDLPWLTGAQTLKPRSERSHTDKPHGDGTHAHRHHSERTPRPASEHSDRSTGSSYNYTGPTTEYPPAGGGSTAEHVAPPLLVLNEDDESSAWMQGAKYEASRLSVPLIGVQHLLLSILVGQKSEVSSFLRAHVYADRLRMALELIVHDRNDPENLKENRFTVAARKVLEKAYAISLVQKRSSIAPQDLLWALLECAPASSIGGVIDGCSGTTAAELMNGVLNHFFGSAAESYSTEETTQGHSAPQEQTALYWSASWRSQVKELVQNPQCSSGSGVDSGAAPEPGSTSPFPGQVAPSLVPETETKQPEGERLESERERPIENLSPTQQSPSQAQLPDIMSTMAKLAKSYVDLSSGPTIPETTTQFQAELTVTPDVLDVLCDALDLAKECKHLTATAYHVTHSLLVKALEEPYTFGWLRREFVAALQAYLLDLTDVKTDIEDLSGSVPRFGPDVRALMYGAHTEMLERDRERFVDLQHVGLALLKWKEVSEAFNQHGMQPQSIRRSLINCLNWHRGRSLANGEVGFPLDLDVLEDLYMQDNLGPNAKGRRDDYLKRLSSRSRYVLRSAGKASELFGNNEVAVEHVVLGLLREKECVAADVLSSQGIDFHEALTKYMAVCSKGSKRHSSPQKLSTRSHRILKTAWKFAQEFKQVLVEPEHILLSIVAEHEGVAYLAWNCLNLSAKETKSLLLARLRGG